MRMRSLFRKLTTRADQAATRLGYHVARHHLVYVAAFSLLTVGSALIMTRLDLKSDFVDLLPDNFQSVRDLRRTSSIVGGLGDLSLAIESQNVKASQRLADDIATMLDEDFRDRVRYYDYSINAVRSYYSENAALFVDLPDLEAIRDRLKHKPAPRSEAIPGPMGGVSPDTEDRDASPNDVDFSDIEAKYRSVRERDAEFIDGYYTGEDGHLLVMLIKPRGSSTSIPAIRKLIAELTVGIETLQPTRYAPDLRFSFAGSYKIGLEEFETLKNDIVGTALLCGLLVALAVLLYFRRMRAVILLAAACVAAIFCTFAVAHLVIGYVNTVTAFLGAIIAGTGVNYGIMLLARYFEERRLGGETRDALVTAIRKTLRATFGAASTTAIAFAVFMLADVRSLSQFGFVGSVGVAFVWVASYTFLPALLMLSERLLPSVNVATTDRSGLIGDKLNLALFSRITRYDRSVVAVLAAAALVSGIIFTVRLPAAIEYDMSKLRTKSSIDSGTAMLNQRISKIFHTSMTPAAIIAETPEQGRAICDALYKKKNEAGNASGIERCRSVYSSLPAQQTEKIAVLKEIRQLIDGPVFAELHEKQREQLADFRRTIPQRELTISDLPPQMTRYFTDAHGHMGTFVYVDPRAGRNLWSAENLQRFTDDIREIRLEDGQVVTSSGDAVIFADLLALLKRDSPLAAGLSFLAVFALVLLTFGSLRSSMHVAGSLLVGTLLMMGAMTAAGVKLNFINFVALPMTFGIGVDYAINIYQRYLQEGPGSIGKVLRRTGGAVVLCSTTTMIGYFTLITANSRALVSLGALAILGELTCLCTALIALPAFIRLRETARPAV